MPFLISLQNKRILLAIGLVAIATRSAAQTPPTGPPTTPPVTSPSGPPTGPAVGGTGACEIHGTILGPSDFNVPAGQPVADVSAVRLPDGRIRLYVFAQGRGIVSAVSLTPEGVTFVPETGSRLPDGSGMPRAIALPDGSWRLFFTSANGIKSATSSDGLSFREEAGFRITANQAGFTSDTVPFAATSGATVIRLPDGRYRMYFSDLPRPGDQAGGHRIKSAISTDMLDWTMEPGVRIGPGAPSLTESAEHPVAHVNRDGSITLFYGKFGVSGSASVEGAYWSTSADGLTFQTERLAVFFANDPDIVRLDESTLLLYYGGFSQQVGGTILVARCPDTTP